jgi:hypothetical protein
MSGDGLRQVRSLVSQYRVAMLIAACVVAFASLFGRHINTSDEAEHAVAKVYGAMPHFELVLKEPARPTR